MNINCVRNIILMVNSLAINFIESHYAGLNILFSIFARIHNLKVFICDLVIAIYCTLMWHVRLRNSQDAKCSRKLYAFLHIYIASFPICFVWRYRTFSPTQRKIASCSHTNTSVWKWFNSDNFPYPYFMHSGIVRIYYLIFVETFVGFDNSTNEFLEFNSFKLFSHCD